LADLEEVIKTAIQAALKETHTALPCQVISFNAAKQTVDVQPAIKRIFSDGDEVLIPQITGVRIGYQRVNDFAITFPITKGDEGVLIFNERSIEAWRQSGDLLAPNDTRTHDYSDALFLPMMYSDPKVISSVSGTDLEIRTSDGTGKISIAPDGKMELENSGGKVLQTVSDTLGELGITTVTVTGGSSAGTYNIDNQANFLALQSVIDAIKK